MGSVVLTSCLPLQETKQGRIFGVSNVAVAFVCQLPRRLSVDVSQKNEKNKIKAEKNSPCIFKSTYYFFKKSALAPAFVLKLPGGPIVFPPPKPTHLAFSETKQHKTKKEKLEKRRIVSRKNTPPPSLSFFVPFAGCLTPSQIIKEKQKKQKKGSCCCVVSGVTCCLSGSETE